jgi:hypothetical protein
MTVLGSIEELDAKGKHRYLHRAQHSQYAVICKANLGNSCCLAGSVPHLAAGREVG